MFGEFIRSKRVELKITLREFVKALKFDPCSWSRIESERVAPPQENEVLLAIAIYLDLDFDVLQDMAYRDKDIVRVPFNDEELVKHLPIFLPKEWEENRLLQFAEWMRERL